MESPIEQGDLDFSSLELDPDDIYLPMGRGYRPTPEMEATLAELKQEIAQVCTPHYYVRYLPAGPSRGGMLQAGDTCFHAGGIIGGISNGNTILFRAAMKPTSSIAKEQKTIDEAGSAVTISVHGRHDPCLVPRAVPVVEAMTALVLIDALLQNRCARL